MSQGGLWEGVCVTWRSVGGCMCHREGCGRVYVS